MVSYANQYCTGDGDKAQHNVKITIAGFQNPLCSPGSNFYKHYGLGGQGSDTRENYVRILLYKDIAVCQNPTIRHCCLSESYYKGIVVCQNPTIRTLLSVRILL